MTSWGQRHQQLAHLSPARLTCLIWPLLKMPLQTHACVSLPVVASGDTVCFPASSPLVSLYPRVVSVTQPFLSLPSQDKHAEVRKNKELKEEASR